MATFAEYARQSCLGSTTNSAKYSAWCRAAGGWLSVVGTLPVGLVGGAVYSPAPWDAHSLKQMATTQSHRHQPGSHCSVVCRFSTHQPSYSLLALKCWLPGCMPLFSDRIRIRSDLEQFLSVRIRFRVFNIHNRFVFKY